MIGKNIKRVRRSKDITLKKLEEMTGINFVQLHKYEVGKTAPGFDKVSLIAKALECSLDELAQD